MDLRGPDLAFVPPFDVPSPINSSLRSAIFRESLDAAAGEPPADFRWLFLFIARDPDAIGGVEVGGGGLATPPRLLLD